MKRSASLLILAFAFAGCGRVSAPKEAPAPTSASLVRVNSTNQPYDFLRPWIKKAPSDRQGLGVVVDGGILVSAELIANHTYVELESPISAEKVAAQVVQVDYDCNLALLRPVDASFLKDAKPLELDDTAKVGDKVDFLQLEATGSVASTPATITTISVAPYPMDLMALLTYRLSSPLQGREGSFTIPAVRHGRLVGLVMRYDSRSQTADLVPSPVIAHFLDDVKVGHDAGVPRVGLGYAPTRDPQLRRYIGLREPGGVYITEVRPDSAAERAGLKKGDVLLAVDNKPIDEDGDYQDDRFGPLSFSHITSTLHHVGDTVTFTVFRNGNRLSIPMKLAAVNRDKIISEPYVFDRQPKYFILGGLVFQELSRPYLEEWGNNWMKEAPQNLVAADAFQNEQPDASGKIVFLSQVLPTTNTVGYEDLNHLIVTKVNGQPIKSLNDLAKAVESPIGGYQKIEFADDPPFIYLDAAETDKTDAQIRQEYGLPELKNLK